MKMYHISELEQLSGIKAPTIRVWERRYNLIQPGRTDTNIRMYDDRQVLHHVGVTSSFTMPRRREPMAKEAVPRSKRLHEERSKR